MVVGGSAVRGHASLLSVPRPMYNWSISTSVVVVTAVVVVGCVVIWRNAVERCGRRVVGPPEVDTTTNARSEATVVFVNHVENIPLDTVDR